MSVGKFIQSHGAIQRVMSYVKLETSVILLLNVQSIPVCPMTKPILTPFCYFFRILFHAFCFS